MLIRRNCFHMKRFLSLLYAPLHYYLYDVASRYNEFYGTLCFEFFSLVVLLQQCVESLFCFFAIRSRWRFAITTDSSALMKLVVSN